MFVIFSVLSFFCAMLWYLLIEHLLHGVSVEIVSLSNPIFSYSELAVASFVGSIVLSALFEFVRWYRMSGLSKRSILYAELACFLGLNLGVLLRSIMLIRTELAQSAVYIDTNEVVYPLDNCLFFYWGLGGSVSGGFIAFFVLIALSLLQSEEK